MKSRRRALIALGTARPVRRRLRQRRPAAAARHEVAIIACTDAHLDVSSLLGLAEGDAHVIRNVGRVVTEDALRVAISQRLLGIEDDHAHPAHRLRHGHLHRRRLPAQHRAGHRHRAHLGRGVHRLHDDVPQNIARIHAEPSIPRKGSVRGFVYDVRSGTLEEISAATS